MLNKTNQGFSRRLLAITKIFNAIKPLVCKSEQFSANPESETNAKENNSRINSERKTPRAVK